MADAKKLTSLDASFLYLETPEMPMHVGSMAIFRLPEDYKGDFFEEFKAMIASRLHIAPILKARLEKAPLDIDHPSWVEDDQFDIDRHIFRGSLPAPHDRATLERIVGWMHAKLLNRARPLWEFYVFEGMKDNEIGLYSKMHHACIDGGAGAALTSMIYDVTPVPREVEPPAARKVAAEPRDIAANLIDSYRQLWTQPFDASAARKSLELPRSGKSDLGSILFDNAMFQIETAVKFAASVPTMLKSVSDVIGKVSDPKSRDSLASMASPPTILNKTISSERSFGGVSISLSRAKALGKLSGGKLKLCFKRAVDILSAICFFPRQDARSTRGFRCEHQCGVRAFGERNLKPARAVGVTAASLAACLLYRMLNVLAPLRLRMVFTCIGKNAQLAIRRRRKSEAGLRPGFGVWRLERMCVGRKVKIRAAVALSLAVKAPVFNVRAHGQAHIGIGGELLPLCELFRRTAE